MAPVSPRRARLAARLKAIRTGAAPSGGEFARIIGWQQPRVSKLETGKQLPTETDIRAWVAAAGASESVAAELLGLLAAARIEYVTHKDESRIDGGLSKVQDAHAVLEARAMYIAEWQPAMVPGLMQTRSVCPRAVRTAGPADSHRSWRCRPGGDGDWTDTTTGRPLPAWPSHRSDPR